MKKRAENSIEFCVEKSTPKHPSSTEFGIKIDIESILAIT
jgi:hypothetical protein